MVKQEHIKQRINVETAQLVVIVLSVIGYVMLARHIIVAKDYEKTENGAKVKHDYTVGTKLLHLLLAILPFILIAYLVIGYGGAVIEGLTR